MSLWTYRRSSAFKRPSDIVLRWSDLTNPRAELARSTDAVVTGVTSSSFRTCRTFGNKSSCSETLVFFPFFPFFFFFFFFFWPARGGGARPRPPPPGSATECVRLIQYCRVPKNGGQTVPAWIVLIFHDFSQSRSFFTIRLRVT